jgi:pyruvate,water dikinase
VVLDRIYRLLRPRQGVDLKQFKELFQRFQQILTGNNQVLELISELEDKLSGEYIFDINYLLHMTDRLSEQVCLVISHLNVITGYQYRELLSRQATIQEELERIVKGRIVWGGDEYVVDYDEIDSDITEIVGGKNATLGEIRNHLRMITPDGFVLTTAAYRRFMEYNNLWGGIRKVYEACWGNDRNSIERYNQGIDTLFGDARIPPDLARPVTRRLKGPYRRREHEAGWAVRSSAYGEDAQGRSYAGQFKSFLNCPVDDVLSAYGKVIASRFRHAIAVYSGKCIVDEAELPMAVGVQETIRASSAGVLYSVEPSGSRVDCMAISAGLGLGTDVVGGMADVDHYVVSRLDPTQIVEHRTAAKRTELQPGRVRGLERVSVREDRQGQASLTDDQVVELAKGALLLDGYFKRPVDVEWCFDSRGKLYILQCRPLMLPPRPRAQDADLRRALAKQPVIMRGKGLVAQRGIAAGRIRQVEEDDDPSEFPVGAIAVTKYTTPRLTLIIRRAAAIVTDIGSSSGHMATVAREFGVPMIVNATDATRLLNEGDEVTVDAEDNIVYQGIVNELLEYRAGGEDVFRDLKEYHILRRLLRRISPLYLLDPNHPNFTARNCRTYHDMVHFSHEKAVQQLIDLSVSSRLLRGIESKVLTLPVPLGLSVIDLGGGLTFEACAKEIGSLDQIQSVPMKAILKGLTSPGAWSTRPTQLGFGGLVSSLTRYTMAGRAAEYQGHNLAVVSDRYANVSLQLGYHFNVIDTYVSDNVNDNYIYFRFVGGVTETARRHLRAMLIKEILEKLYFKATVSGDLVVARLKKWEAKEVLRVLEEIGRLIGFTRQLDTQMYSKESIKECFHAFFGQRRGDD